MMLTEKECREALKDLYNSICELEEIKSGVETTCVFDDSLDCFKELIDQHFDNPPLKFDELNKGYPIYDNDEIVCGWKFIYMIDKEYKQLLLIDEEGNVDWVNYKENRFYRKEVQE